MFSAMPIFSQDNSTIQTYAIFKQIKSENELTTASQAYDIADWYGGSTKIKNFSIPFTSSGFVYRYSGTIKAGVNLKTAKFKFRKKDKTIVVTLNQPMILSNTMDPKRTGVRYEETTSSISFPLLIWTSCKRKSSNRASSNQSSWGFSNRRRPTPRRT